MKNSEFTRCLSDLIDKTGIKRNDWASMLSISTSAISQWLSGCTLPRPDNLNAIISILENYSQHQTERGNIQRFTEQFHTMASQPLNEVVTEDVLQRLRGILSVSEYMMKPNIERLTYDLSKLKPDVAKELVFFLSDLSKTLTSFKNGRTVPLDVLKLTLKKLRSEKLVDTLNEELNNRKRPPFESPRIRESKDLSSKISSNDFKNKMIVLDNRFGVPSTHADSYRVRILLWDFSTDHPISSIQASEAFFYKMAGEFEWQFEGLPPIDLNKNNFLTIRTPALREGENGGLPQSKILVGKAGYGILVLFNEAGIGINKLSVPSPFSLDEIVGRFISNQEFTEEYLNRISLATLKLQVNPQELEKHILRGKPRVIDPHQKLRSDGQLKDAQFEEISQQWDISSKDNAANISASLMKFIPARVNLEDTIFVMHYGLEIIIPLIVQGKMSLLSCGKLEEDSIDTTYKLKDLNQAEYEQRIIEGPPSENGIPHIAIFSSETPHAFLVNDKPAFCLHIRILRTETCVEIIGNQSLDLKDPRVQLNDMRHLESAQKTLTLQL